MQIKKEIYRTSCLMRMIAVIGVLTLAGCMATVTSYNPDGSKVSEAKVPFGYQYNTDTKMLSGDPIIMEHGTKAAVEILKNSPEAVAKIAEVMSKEQDKQLEK